jgi:tetratricopeptide (TPR) repeat protein
MRLNSQLPEVHVTLGRIHNLVGKHDLGLQEIQHALKLDPINAKGLLALGDAYSSVSRDGEAEQAYSKAIALRPDDWDAYQRRGSFYFEKG